MRRSALDLAKKLMEMPASKVDIKEVLLSDRFFTEDINTHESATSVIPGLDGMHERERRERGERVEMRG